MIWVLKIADSRSASTEQQKRTARNVCALCATDDCGGYLRKNTRTQKNDKLTCRVHSHLLKRILRLFKNSCWWMRRNICQNRVHLQVGIGTFTGKGFSYFWCKCIWNCCVRPFWNDTSFDIHYRIHNCHVCAIVCTNHGISIQGMDYFASYIRSKFIKKMHAQIILKLRKYSTCMSEHTRTMHRKLVQVN